MRTWAKAPTDGGATAGGTPALQPAPSQSGVSSPCPICGEERRAYLFVVHGLQICRCPGCGLVTLHAQPAAANAADASAAAPANAGPAMVCADSGTELEAAQRYVRSLKLRGLERGRLLLVAAPGHPVAAEAKSSGYDVALHISIAELEGDTDLKGPYDGVVVCHQLEKATDAAAAARRLQNALRPGGVLLLTAPSIESWPRSFFGQQWTEWRPENRYYFGPATAQSLLLKHGFEHIWVTPDRRRYTLRHVYRRAVTFPRTTLTRLIRLLFHITPPPFRDMSLRFACSGMIVTATRATLRERPLCSIVVPAYNEHATFPALMKGLLAKEIPGADKEIIIVESNSTDGTRDLVTACGQHPGVTVVLQDRPRGKGNAVRAGLQQARGDIVLIQDADLEYDLNDYDALVEPLLKYRAAFVLGSRHGGNWKMRQFTDSAGLAAYLNVGHIFFTFLVNTLYRQRMKDPFTMYKVFRRDCLYGLEFECNRFDFDFELVIKLVRKGYTPLELPVNYRSRSFKEGKKVRMVRDPLTWIRAAIKYRFVRISRLPR
ncbi:MAG: glycosyltransferase family 2 protein [Planctomycetota bacterium]|nr:glycosyltransferase family 2 protein [Planctomycetota bacterium]